MATSSPSRWPLDGILDDQLQPVERRLQIVGDVDADLPHALEERGETLKGGIDLHGQHVDVVAIAVIGMRAASSPSETRLIVAAMACMRRWT